MTRPSSCTVDEPDICLCLACLSNAECGGWCTKCVCVCSNTHWAKYLVEIYLFTLIRRNCVYSWVRLVNILSVRGLCAKLGWNALWVY